MDIFNGRNQQMNYEDYMKPFNGNYQKISTTDDANYSDVRYFMNWQVT